MENLLDRLFICVFRIWQSYMLLTILLLTLNFFGYNFIVWDSLWISEIFIDMKIEYWAQLFELIIIFIILNYLISVVLMRRSFF